MANKDVYKTLGIQKVNNLKGVLDSLQPIDKENLRRLEEKFRLEFNYNSNHIEGNTLTYGQTVMVLKFGKITGDVYVSDVNEMKAHDVALKLVSNYAKEIERPLTENFLKELNEIILVAPFWKEAISPDGQPTRKKIEIGKYKTTPNSVMLKNGEMFYYATPEETPSKMSDLMNWYRQNLEILHPVHLAAEFHYRFVRIHPFDDGNGRVARLIMNYILQRFDYPTVIIKSTDKDGYLTALQKADVGDLKSLLEYIENQIIWSIEISIKAAKGEDIEEDDDLDKEIELLRREKLTQGVIHKTPFVIKKMVFDLENIFWSNLVKQQLKFSDFFTEVQYFISVDDKKILHPTDQITSEINFNSLLGESNNYPVHEVFGFDLNEQNIKRVKWEMRMLGLVRCKNRVDYSLAFSVDFFDSDYKIRLVLMNPKPRLDMTLRDDEVIFKDTKKYNEFYFQDELSEISKMVSKRLLNMIKTNE